MLLNNNLTWLVRIPTDIAPGNYVLRHEMIALHAAGNANGAQNYPFCFNLAISGSGTKSPEGMPATQLYKANDPGILYDLFTKHSTYVIPGVSAPVPPRSLLLRTPYIPVSPEEVTLEGCLGHAWTPEQVWMLTTSPPKIAPAVHGRPERGPIQARCAQGHGCRHSQLRA